MSKSNRRQSKTETVLQELYELIISLKHLREVTEDSKHTLPGTKQPLIIMSKRDYGSLSLQGDSAQRYISILNSASLVVNSEIISRKAIDRLFRDTILRSLDINDKEAVRDYEARVRQLVNEAKVFLSGKAAFVSKIHIRVSGVQVTYEPDHFGGIKFIVLDEGYLSEIKRDITHSQLSEHEQSLRLDLIKQFTEEKLVDKTVAIVNTQAMDFEAAHSQALRKLQAVVDLMNFYSDLLYPPKAAFVRIFGNEEHSIESLPAIVQRERPVLHQSTRRVGPIQTFQMHDLIHGKGQGVGSGLVSQLMAKEQRTQVEERVISAMQWAGRATIDERNEEAFLLYTIALESLVMERANEAELGYRLRLRVAHLLGNSVEERKSIHDEVKRLYIIRSAIVHKGSFEVAQADLESVRYITKEAIATILLKEPFLSLQTDEKLFDWFADQLLR